MKADDWIDSGLIFTTFAHSGKGGKVGKPLHPRNVLRTLYGILKAAELSASGFTISGTTPRAS